MPADITEAHDINVEDNTGNYWSECEDKIDDELGWVYL